MRDNLVSFHIVISVAKMVTDFCCSSKWAKLRKFRLVLIFKGSNPSIFPLKVAGKAFMEPLLPSHISNLVFLKSQLSIWSPYTIPSITLKDKMYKHLTDKTIFSSNFVEKKAIGQKLA